MATLFVSLLCAAVAVVTVTVRAGADDHCRAFADAASRLRQSPAMGDGDGLLSDVLVIGDSYSVGLGVGEGQGWPSRLPGRVRVEGFSGSGYSRDASGCGDVSFASRAPRALRDDTRLVIVEGGLNDVDQPAAAIRDGFERLMRTVDGRRVLVVGPPSAPDRAEVVPTVDALLARLAADHGASYLSLLEHDFPYLDDGLHLTAEGHRLFGDAVAAALLREVA